MKACFVYVLWSEIINRKYVGISHDVMKRMEEHNSGKTKSTKAFMPWKIIYTEKFENRGDARKREQYFKSAAGRRFLKQKLSLK